MVLTNGYVITAESPTGQRWHTPLTLNFVLTPLIWLILPDLKKWKITGRIFDMFVSQFSLQSIWRYGRIWLFFEFLHEKVNIGWLVPLFISLLSRAEQPCIPKFCPTALQECPDCLNDLSLTCFKPRKRTLDVFLFSTHPAPFLRQLKQRN